MWLEVYNQSQNFQRILQNSTEPEKPKQSRCELFSLFSIFVQGILAVLTYLVLVLKRYREKPRRPWKIWFFDTSKQVCSAVTQHLLNLLLSVISNNVEISDECVWYFINFLMDTTIGIFFCYLMMKAIKYYVDKYNISILKSGFYFEKENVNGKMKYRLKIKMYFFQLINWLVVIIINKLMLFGINRLARYPLEVFGNFILKPFFVHEKLELVMVMIVFPVIFNITQFWIFDEILKFNPTGTDSKDLIIDAMKDEEYAQQNEDKATELTATSDSLNTSGNENSKDTIVNKQ